MSSTSSKHSPLSSPKSSPGQGIKALVDLLANAGLEDTYNRFLVIVEGPPDGSCLIPVCEGLLNTFEALPFWKNTEPFERWDELVKLVVDNSERLQRSVGPHLCPEPKTTIIKNGGVRQENLMYGRIVKYPLYAMLSDEQEDENYRILFGALQLQILAARWREATAKATKNHEDPIDILKFSNDSPNRTVRHPLSISETVRALTARKNVPLLEYLEPNIPPEQFLDFLRSKHSPPLGEHFKTRFSLIKSCCVKRGGARTGEKRSGGKRGPSRPRFLEYVGYSSLRVGVELSSEEENAPTQESINERSEDEQSARKLGLHPLELAGGMSILRSKVPGAQSALEAKSIARSNARSREIDRRLFPWANNQMRLTDFHRGILPELVKVCYGQSVTKEDLALATLLGISIETGRSVEDVLDMKIQSSTPDSGLAYQRDRSKRQFGAFYWLPIEPEYESTREFIAEKEWQRATYLQYSASGLISDLIERYCQTEKISSGKLFSDDLDYGSALKKWIKMHDSTGRATARKLARLRWGALHRITGGELAVTCLVLGIREHEATVEMHYAVLEVKEATRLFRESSSLLWGKYLYGSNGSSIGIRELETANIIGIRGFPMLSEVCRVISWMREGSEKFFQLEVNKFDPDRDMELLNRAVLYVVWHQFFGFATRAIRNGYQKLDSFAKISGIAKLSDKDFADHHKTRMIWAEERLLAHMAAVEERLVQLRAQLNGFRFRNKFPVWFIGPKKKILPITPGNIEKLLQKEFPFDVNTPRKVMRYLLRIKGLTHDQAEVYMGHWCEAREPWSPFSSFDWQAYLNTLKELVPAILDDLGFEWKVGEMAK